MTECSTGIECDIFTILNALESKNQKGAPQFTACVVKSKCPLGHRGRVDRHRLRMTGRGGFMHDLKVLAIGKYWVCDSMDLLAPITETGTEVLTISGEYLPFKDGEKLPAFIMASEEEKKAYLNKYGIVFIGDKVEVIKGKLKGSIKTVSGFYRYIIPNTYGKAYTDYLIFDDNTKTNIFNCSINGTKCLIFRERAEIRVGGRL